MAKLAGHSIVEKARSFATLLAGTRELRRFHYVQDILRQDEEAKALLQQFTKIQQEIQELRRGGREMSGDLAARLQGIRSDLTANAVIADWDAGRADAIALIQAAGQVVSNVSGVDLRQSPPTGGCGT